MQVRAAPDFEAETRRRHVAEEFIDRAFRRKPAG
jgi:hypothetical protein